MCWPRHKSFECLVFCHMISHDLTISLERGGGGGGGWLIVSKIHRVIYVGLQKKLDNKSAILLVAREMHQRDKFRPLMRAYGSERIKALAEGQKSD